MSEPGPVVRRLASAEVALHRTLRLRALQDSPESFGETYADAAAQPPDHWVVDPAWRRHGGFRETGERRPLPTNPSRWIVARERPL